MAVPKLILREHLQALGWPGLAGGAALLLSLAYGAAVVLPADQEQQRTRLQVATLAASHDGEGAAAVAATPAAQQENFYRDFPAQADVTRWIERIYSAAAAAKLSLARGEYALAPVTDTRLARYQITLPVRGDYGRIRRFIAATLAAVPNLSLDELTLERENIDETEVSGQLRLSLYLVKS